MAGNYLILVDENGEAYLAHHGIKGQKWGVRRFQNPDGTWTDAGKARYLNPDGSLNKRGIKREAKQEYKKKIREINKAQMKNDEEHDKKKIENIYGFDSGGIKDRFRKHIENEYSRNQQANKLNQKALDARREYRQKIGKKHIDTFGMKWMQQNINEISDMSQAEYTRNYIKNALTDAVQTAAYYNNRRTSNN